MPTEVPLLQLAHVGRRKPGSTAWLLRDLSLDLAAGDRLAIVGPTGAGKTLLLRSVALLDPLDSGEMRWRGQPVAPASIPAFRSRNIYLHQRPALLPGTVEANLRIAFSLSANRSRGFDIKEAISLVERVGRDESFLKRSVQNLSGGEGQMVAFLRALLLQPDALLLDEPTASLDSATAGVLEDLVAHWCANRVTQRAFIWVTHQIDQARRVSNRLLEMRSGKIERDGE